MTRREKRRRGEEEEVTTEEQVKLTRVSLVMGGAG